MSLGHLDGAEATREGFASAIDFEQAFTAINGRYDPRAIVWRIEFESLAHSGGAPVRSTRDTSLRPRVWRNGREAASA